MYYIWFSFKKEKLYYNIWEVILGFGELIVMIYAILNFLAWVKGFNIQGNFFLLCINTYCKVWAKWENGRHIYNIWKLIIFIKYHVIKYYGHMLIRDSCPSSSYFFFFKGRRYIRYIYMLKKIKGTRESSLQTSVWVFYHYMIIDLG